MKHALVLAISIFLGCSDDGDSTPRTFDQASADFTTAVCTSGCAPMSEADCRADVTQDLADAKAELDANGQAECVRCLDVKSEVIAMLASCTPTAAQDATVFAACDLDPAVDFDGDGTADNDYDEACAGKP